MHSKNKYTGKLAYPRLVSYFRLPWSKTSVPSPLPISTNNSLSILAVNEGMRVHLYYPLGSGELLFRRVSSGKFNELVNQKAPVIIEEGEWSY